MSKEIVKKFGIDLKPITESNEKINGLVKLSEDTIIENDDALQIAKGNLKTMKELSKNIDETRKGLTRDFREAVSFINETAKYYKDNMLDVAIDVMNGKIISYANIAEAQRKAEEADRMKQAEASANDKEDAMNRFIRIRTKMYSYLIGGAWIEKDGSQKTHGGCKIASQVNDLFTQVKKTFPKPEEFGYLAKQSKLLLGEFSQDCAYLISAFDSKELTDDERSDKVDALRANIVEKNNSIAKEFGIELAKEGKDEKKEILEHSKIVGKNIRKTIKFNIIAENEVPRAFMTVDERKVNEYIRVHRDKLLEALKNGKQPLNGISFHVEKKVV